MNDGSGKKIVDLRSVSHYLLSPLSVMLLSRCALFWRDFLLGAGRCFVIPIPQLCLLWRVSAVPDKSWAALFLHFPFQREKTEYFSVCWVCYLHLLLTNGALAAVCHFAAINPSWLILNSGLESSGVLTLHLFLLLSIHTCNDRASAYRSLIFFHVTYAPHFRAKWFSWNAGPPSTI